MVRAHSSFSLVTMGLRPPFRQSARRGRTSASAPLDQVPLELVKRSLSHVASGCGLSHIQSSGDDGAGPLELFAGDDGLTPAPPTARKSSANALLDQVPLELTQRTDQVEDQAPARRRCVDRLGDGAEPRRGKGSEAAKQRLLEHLRSQPAIEIGPFKREELYDC